MLRLFLVYIDCKAHFFENMPNIFRLKDKGDLHIYPSINKILLKDGYIGKLNKQCIKENLKFKKKKGFIHRLQ